jgi:multiple sugar transport system substrate-binding protein
LLGEFETEHQVRVHIRTLTWDSSWSELLKFVFQGHGPVVSEVGNTRVHSMAKMNAFRYFDEAEVYNMGGEAAFIPATWHHVTGGEERIWSVPWLAESRVIIYRRDLLEAAGVDEETAFDSHDHLRQTLEKLKTGGVETPWIVPTKRTANTLHTLPSWIWGAGGDFVDANYRRVAFADKEARAGIRDYYSLYLFLNPDHHELNPFEAEQMFMEGRAAVTVSGPWTVFPVNPVSEGSILEKIGVAKMPGVSCVLASDLVIWKHTPVRQEQLAIELVKFLTAHKAQHTISRQSGMIPARMETLDTEPFSEDPNYGIFINSLLSGRSLPTMRLWGLIEERLTNALAVLWHKILAEPEPDLDKLIVSELTPLAKKLNNILE